MPKKKKIEKNNKKPSMMLDVYDIKGKIIGKTKLPEEIFGIKVNKKIIAQAVRVYLSNRRQGTHSTKTRSQIRASTRKIYRQKGTGRARHGDIKAPIFKGGGIAHGPKPRDYSLSMPVKMKRLALFSAFSEKLKKDKVLIIDNLDKLKPKTKIMFEFLTSMKLENKKNNKNKNVLLVLAEKNDNVFRAGRNIVNLAIKEARLINTYAVLSHQTLLVEKKAIEKLKKRLLKKNQINKKEKDKEVQNKLKPKTSTKTIKNKKDLKNKIKGARKTK